jgi:phage terminase large subunit-like protein
MWESYIKDVLSGKRNAGRLERLTVERFLQLQQNPLYYFDKAHAEQVLHFIGQFKHTKGSFKGVPFKIMPWQAFFWAYIFGMKHKDDDTRLVREVLLCMAKKGGKSEVGGATGVFMTFFDGEPGAECYSAANSLDQAEFSWNSGAIICEQLIQDDEEFASYCRVYNSVNNRKIIDTSTGSFFKTIAAENRTLDGVNPHFALIDEFHAARDDSIPKNLRSGMVGRTQPMLMYVTTRGFNPLGELARLEHKHINLLDGKVKDDSAMSLIFAFDPEDEEHLKADWGKEITDINTVYWGKSNPGLGIAPSLRGLQSMYTDAMNEGVSAQVNFFTKNMNIWVRQEKTWITDNVWMTGNRKINLSSLDNRMCFGAFDLSASRDLTAYGLLFPPDDEGGDFVFICKYYIPEEGADTRAKRDQVPYLDWAKAGLVTLTDGNVTDQDKIKADIIDDGGKYQIESIHYDRWQSDKLAIELRDEGANVLPCAQTVTVFNEPIRMIEALIEQRQLVHGGDPVLRWMVGNAVIKYSNGLCKFDKDKSIEKIDGLVVLAMCFVGYLNWLANNNFSKYNQSDLNFL